MVTSKILSYDELQTKRAAWRLEGLQVVLTNGCFDVLHLGHVDYLEKAAALGDKLIVAINTDASVKQLKGSGRPITDEKARSRIIASLSFVDAVVLFEDLTPLHLIEVILPDILVKGSDYDRSNIVGADIVEQKGGKVETIEIVKGYSTTQIIEKIRSNRFS